MPTDGPARLTESVVDGLGVRRRRPEHLDGNLPAVVLVHGAMDRAASFGRVMRRLVGIDVCAYDRRGYASSLGSGISATLGEQAADLAAVLDWLGAERAVVVGHSFGGTVALRLAAAGSSPLVGIGAFESPVPGLPSYRSEGADLAISAAARGGPAAGAEAFYRLMVGDSTWQRLRSVDRSTRLAEGAQLVAELVALRHRSEVPDLGAIDVPVVVGAGGASNETWRRSAQELAERLASASYVEIAGAGHGAHLSHPDEFARYVRTCLGVTDPM